MQCCSIYIANFVTGFKQLIHLKIMARLFLEDKQAFKLYIVSIYLVVKLEQRREQRSEINSTLKCGGIFSSVWCWCVSLRACNCEPIRSFVVVSQCLGGRRSQIECSDTIRPQLICNIHHSFLSNTRIMLYYTNYCVIALRGGGRWIVRNIYVFNFTGQYTFPLCFVSKQQCFLIRIPNNIANIKCRHQLLISSLFSIKLLCCTFNKNTNANTLILLSQLCAIKQQIAV